MQLRHGLVRILRRVARVDALRAATKAIMYGEAEQKIEARGIQGAQRTKATALSMYLLDLGGIAALDKQQSAKAQARVEHTVSVQEASKRSAPAPRPCGHARPYPGCTTTPLPALCSTPSASQHRLTGTILSNDTIKVHIARHMAAPGGSVRTWRLQGASAG